MTCPNYTADSAREQRIESAYRQFAATTDPKALRRHYLSMVGEIAQRSPEQVERMEERIRGAN